MLTVTEQGFYEVRRPGSAEPLLVVAANLDPSESDLRPIDAAEFAAAVEPQDASFSAGDNAPALAPEERERPQAIWWYLLVAAFLMLAAETFVGNHLSRGGAT